MRIEEYKNENKITDTTCWIFGSGKSLDFIDDSFFNDKFTIGVNDTYKRYNLDIIVRHHHNEGLIKCLNDGNTVFLSRKDQCKPDGHTMEVPEDRVVWYNHMPQGYMNTNFTPIEDPKENLILTGGTTVINAVGVAVYLGFKNIVLCGCDGMAINGEVNYIGYYNDNKNPKQLGHASRSKILLNQVKFVLDSHGINVCFLNAFN